MLLCRRSILEKHLVAASERTATEVSAARHRQMMITQVLKVGEMEKKRRAANCPFPQLFLGQSLQITKESVPRRVLCVSVCLSHLTSQVNCNCNLAMAAWTLFHWLRVHLDK